MPSINFSGFFLVSCKKLRLVISHRMIFNPSLISSWTLDRCSFCLNIESLNSINLNRIIMMIASLIWTQTVVFCVTFAVLVEIIVIRNNIKEFGFETKIIWHTFFVRIIFRCLKTFHFQNLWELKKEKNIIDRLEPYGIIHSWYLFQFYMVTKFLYWLRILIG